MPSWRPASTTAMQYWPGLRRSRPTSYNGWWTLLLESSATPRSLTGACHSYCTRTSTGLMCLSASSISSACWCTTVSTAPLHSISKTVVRPSLMSLADSIFDLQEDNWWTYRATDGRHSAVEPFLLLVLRSGTRYPTCSVNKSTRTVSSVNSKRFCSPKTLGLAYPAH